MTAEAILNGRDIVAARARDSINQEELAKEAGVFSATLTDLENGRIELTQADYQRLLDLIARIVARRAERS